VEFGATGFEGATKLVHREELATIENPAARRASELEIVEGMRLDNLSPRTPAPSSRSRLLGISIRRTAP